MDDDLPIGEVVEGDCLDVLPELSEESVHAVVTDPPYGLAFMGRDWDDFEPKEYQEWCEEWAGKVKRVLKPGGHLLAFSGNRTHHRLFSGVEDAGFEIRDTICWHYGSGFPKASDISKTIDKREGAEREVVGEKKAPDGVPMKDRVSHSGEEYDETSADYDDCKRDVYIREPATPEAKKWDGWKTGLKPATEYVVVARKPFKGATVDCVLEHGTGALNIEECRIGTDERTNPPTSHNDNCYADAGDRPEETVEGRYPSNVVFHCDEAERLDQEVGELDADAHTTVKESDSVNTYGDKVYEDAPEVRTETDTGGPSRYFYTSKASKRERTCDGEVENEHPTVKPVDLMRWLVRLVTREGQVVLDPFAGSGTTAIAAEIEGREWVLIERDPEHVELSRERFERAHKAVEDMRDPKVESPLEWAEGDG